MKLRKAVLKIISLCVISVVFLTACATQAETTIKKVSTTSEKIYQSAEEVSNINAPTYKLQTSATENSNVLAATVTTYSAEMIVKLGILSASLQTLNSTISLYKTESDKFFKQNIKLGQEHLNSLHDVITNLETIKKMLDEKKVSLQQDIATINTNIQNYIQNSDSMNIDEINSLVQTTYTSTYNAIEYINTKISEVNTVILTATETLQLYTLQQENE